MVSRDVNYDPTRIIYYTEQHKDTLVSSYGKVLIKIYLCKSLSCILFLYLIVSYGAADTRRV